MNVIRVVGVVLQTCVAAGCAMPQLRQSAGTGVETNDVTSWVRNTDLSVRFPTPVSEPSRGSGDAARPMLFPGTEPEIRSPSSPGLGPRVRTASSEPVILTGDGVEINFEGADIANVAKTLLGDVLQLNFMVDPHVQGTVTLASAGPIPRKDVLPALESALRMHNAAIVRDGKLVKIIPISDAAGHTSIKDTGEPGFGVSIVPLHYISASTVAKTAENMLARPGAIKADTARNLLLIQGTAAERESALDIVSTFDVEWLRNQSVGVYPLKSTSPETMIEELERILETSEGGVGQNLIRFQPISRMNAVMVVSKNADLLRQTALWVGRLDRSDTNGTTLRSYRLKYGNATQVAKILNNIFVSGRSGGGDTRTSPLAPGTTTAESRLDSLDRGGGGLNGNANGSAGGGTGGAMGGQSGGGGSGSGGGNRALTPIAASFDAFSNRKKADGDTQDDAASGPGENNPKGLFQHVRITADTVNNAVVIYANQEDYRTIERAVRDFDRPRLQVAIDATVAEVTLTNELTYGVQYYLTSKDLNAGTDKGAIGLVNAVTAAAGSTALQRTVPGFNLLLGSSSQPRVILNALSTITDVKVLSSPSIVALDNQPALLQVGNQIPITTSTATVLTNSNTPVVNTIEMRNTGVILKVLPHVNSNGTIELEVDQEISNVVNPSQQTLTPTISERRVHSTVAVTSGQTVLLGGLISDNDQKTKAGIPGLADFKYIGDLLGNTDGTRTRSEIIIFIRPQVIRNGVDARAVTEEFRDKLHSMNNSARSVISGAGVPGTPPAAAASKR
jgi:general secretion pathway protein D